MFKIIIGVVICTVVLLVVMSQVDKYANQEQDLTSLVGDSNATSLTATITGEVVRPGTYIVNLESTLSALVDAASGVTSNADSDAYDLTYLIENGMSFYIAPEYDNTNACSMSPIVKVNINSANKEQLMSINAIGDTVATSLIDYRASNPFKRIEDIKNVNGIGPATFEKVKNYITIK
jgi:competence protein ComEA